MDRQCLLYCLYGGLWHNITNQGSKVVYVKLCREKKKGIQHNAVSPEIFGAGNGIRTRDFNLGKVALYH